MTTAKHLLWSDEYLLTLFASLDDYCFWNNAKDGGFRIDRFLLLRKFCPAIGIFKLPMDADDKGRPTFTPVFIRGNRIQEVDGNTIQVIIERLLELWDADTGGNVGGELIVKMGFTHNLFDDKGLKNLSRKTGIEVLKDTPRSAYIFFSNGWVEVTADGTSNLKTYEQIPADKFIWENRIIQDDYVTKTSDIQGKTYFLDFISNLSRDEEGNVSKGNLDRIMLALGFLSHRCQIADMRQWVLVVDRNASPNGQANGGNGKSILIRSLFGFLNACEIDGREFRKSSGDRFAFSSVSASTDIVYFDDADSNFDLKRLYSKVTGSWQVDVKFKDTFTIPDKDAPKIAITSNYALGGDDSSTQRRNFQVEISDYYKTQREEYGLRPTDLHDQKLIAVKGGGWNADDWGHYYSTICDCISLYLKKGLPTQSEESITFKRNRLCAQMPVDDKEGLLDYFFDLLQSAVKTGAEIFAEVFYKKTREKFDFPEKFTNREIWELLKRVGKAFRLVPNHDHKGCLKQQRLCGEERKTRWLDEGMQDYRDSNGKDPLEDTNSKVYVFTVTSFLTPQDVCMSHSTDFNKSSDEMTFPTGM